MTDDVDVLVIFKNFMRHPYSSNNFSNKEYSVIFLKFS